MSSAFQNRLVGTIILVALAVIFLPDILDGKKAAQKERFVQVPKQPPAETVAKPSAFPAEEVKARATRQVEIVNETPVDAEPESPSPEPAISADAPASDKSEIASKTVDDYPVTDNPAPARDEAVNAGWVVQLGSFRHRKNVRELKQTLKKAGYRTFTRQVTTNAGELTKVFVGPELERDKLEKALPHLNELTSLKGKITTFTVD